MSSRAKPRSPDAQSASRPHIPAEWDLHRAIWTAWPARADLWLGDLEPAREELAAMIKALAKGDTIKVLAMGEEAMASALDMLGASAKVIPAAYGDIWLRDTGPIFAIKNKKLVALRFKNNGWGGKYDYPEDRIVGDAIAEGAGVPIEHHDFILEGGALEHDGAGTILTTRQCVLNRNRNPGWTQNKAEEALKSAFGAKRILWLDEGLLNDHTDGHIDNIARFVAPGRIVCQSPSGKSDPNAGIYGKIAEDLKEMGLEVIQIPSPGRVNDAHGDPVPASHMNFIIGNDAVVVPTYSTAAGDDAVEALQALFPDRTVVGVNSTALLTGGGSFHCITQQEPLGEH